MKRASRPPSMRYPSVQCLILLASLFVGIIGCTEHKAYRIPEGSIRTSIPDLIRDADHRRKVERYCVERHDEFDLAFIEFDDQGQYWSHRQVSELESTVLATANRSATHGVLLVTFVHGWKHNASVCDENVSCFREVLRTLYNLEQLNALRYGSTPRRVIGVYVGWRGLSVTVPFLREASFYARKSTANRIGRGQLLDLFVRLEYLRNRLNEQGNGNSRLILIGHSFGGAIVYSAVSQILLERLSQAALSDRDTTGQADARVIEGFGDLIVLVNPAFEATLYTSIHELAGSKSTYSERQPVLLVTVSSDTDAATKKAFPWGRFFSTLFEQTRDAQQKKALRTTLGNFEPYRTHRAKPLMVRGGAPPFIIDDLRETDEEAARGAADCKCRYIEATIKTASDLDPWGELADKGLPRESKDGNQGEFGGVDLQRISDQIHKYNPFLVISTADEVVTRHNGIYNRLFINFVRDLLLTMEDRKRKIRTRTDDAWK